MGEIVTIRDEGLGNSSYLLDLGDGRGLVLDPSRDPGSYLAATARRGLRLAYTAETHLHADLVSGSRELATMGATVVAPAAAGLQFPHRGLGGGDEVDLGGLGLRALARALWRSLHERLLTLPDDLAVYPTHGAGSFCSAPTSAEPTTTIGREKATNPLLAAPDEDAFLTLLLGGLGSYPRYFLRLRETNRHGPRVHDATPPPLTPLPPQQVRRLGAFGAELIDARPIGALAAGHVAGALSIPLRSAFATWLGWLVAHDRPLVVVVDPDQDRGELVRQALKVGYERLAGELDGGIAAWQLGRAAGHHGLIAWVRGAQSMVALYAGRLEEALCLAREGQAFSPSPVVRAQLASWGEARALARMGDRRGVLEAIARGSEAIESAQDDRGPRGVFSFSVGEFEQHCGTACLWLKLPAEAKQHAEHAFELRDTVAAKTLARLNVAAAEGQLGNPEEASRIGMEVLDVLTDPGAGCRRAAATDDGSTRARGGTAGRGDDRGKMHSRSCGHTHRKLPSQSPRRTPTGGRPRRADQAHGLSFRTAAANRTTPRHWPTCPAERCPCAWPLPSRHWDDHRRSVHQCGSPGAGWHP